MAPRGTGRGGPRRAALLVALTLAPALSGCGGGPRLNPSGEPVGFPPHVTSQKIDPWTLRPVREMRVSGQEEPKEAPPEKLAE